VLSEQLECDLLDARARVAPPTALRQQLAGLPQILLTPDISASGEANMAGPGTAAVRRQPPPVPRRRPPPQRGRPLPRVLGGARGLDRALRQLLESFIRLGWHQAIELAEALDELFR
jgi:hypothetical protein